MEGRPVFLGQPEEGPVKVGSVKKGPIKAGSDPIFWGGGKSVAFVNNLAHRRFRLFLYY